MVDKKYNVTSPTDFEPVIIEVLQQATAISDHAAVVTLTGDLGAGKTTFTQQLAQYIGVSESVVSPTFGIMKSYEVVGHEQFDRLVHIDAYRIEDSNETGPLRLKELFAESRTIVCLEWPEKIAAIVPHVNVAVTITIPSVKREDREVMVGYYGYDFETAIPRPEK